MKKNELQTSVKSLDSLKGKKFGDLKAIYAGSLAASMSEDAEMAHCITLINSGGTADDSSWDRKK